MERLPEQIDSDQDNRTTSNIPKAAVLEVIPSGSEVTEVSFPSEKIVDKGNQIPNNGGGNHIEEVLENQLPNIKPAEVSELDSVRDPKELGLELIGKDEYGFFIQIPEIFKERIKEAQEKFIPVFKDVHSRYREYEEWKYFNEMNPFVFSPIAIKIMSKEILPLLMKEATELYSNKVDNTVAGRSINWEESDIEGILNKLLAYESYWLERIMAPRARDHMKEAFPNETRLKVKELCTGAGITTALMYEALQETGKEIEFHTVDNSLQSVMCAAALLTVRGVPVRFVLDSDVQEKEFKGVTIYFDLALEAMKKEGSYHFVFSDNGINYFDDESMHYETVEEMIKKIKPGGLFQDCTLDPHMQIDLSIPLMLKSIFGKREKPKLGDDAYMVERVGDNLFIKQFFSPSTVMQYELLNVILKRMGPGLFITYLSGAKKVGEITQKLAPKIAQDLRKTGEKATQITGVKGEYYPTYESRKMSLTRFFELKLPKKDVME